MASRPSWEGHLTFNLVSIPIKAFNAVGAGSGKIGFHLLHKGCNERIRYKKVCPVHGEVANEEIVSGYEYAKGEYAVVPAGEKAKLKAKDDKAIDIDTFVPPAAIDPIYFSGRTYYLVPANPAASGPARGHGRVQERALLGSWIGAERCRRLRISGGRPVSPHTISLPTAGRSRLPNSR